MKNKLEYSQKIPVEIQEKWQKILNLLVKIVGSSEALITRFDPPFLDVFKASENIQSIFEEGSRVKLSKCYCESVIKNDAKVMIINTLEDKKWKSYVGSEEEYLGFLGYPLKWPSGKFFGTLCIHFKKADNISNQTQEIIFEFKELIESHLVIIDKNVEIKRDNKIINSKEKKYQNLVSQAPIGIFETTSDGSIITINKGMAKILDFSSIEDTLKHYNSLGKDLYVNQQRREKFIEILNTNGEVKNFEYKALAKNKKHKWISMNARKGAVISGEEFLIQGFAFDITERKNKDNALLNQKKELSSAFEKLKTYNEEIIAMNEELEDSLQEINILNKKFVHMIELISNMQDKTLLNEKEFFSDLLKNAIEIIPEADFGKVCLINNQDQVEFIDAVGHDMKILEKLTFDKKLLYHRQSISVNHAKNYCFDIHKIEKEKDNFLKAFKSIKESLYINIRINEETVGRLVLDIKDNSQKSFSLTTQSVLESFATLASAFFAFKRFDHLQINFTKELITSIIKIMEMYDLYTKGHSENVAALASAIAKGMNLPKKTIRDTYWAGLVHDIGKLLVPLNIINKKEKLTDTEFEVIKKHPVWGSKALSHSKMLKPISNYILYHHERWDGLGYPYGLEANEIPLISQILSVADAWDAMLSKRAYRHSLSPEQAILEIKRNKDTQFSPLVVETFIKIFEEGAIEHLKQDILDHEINDLKEESPYKKKMPNRFEDLFEESNEGIVILDEDFNIIRANNFFLKMFEYDAENIIGSSIKKIVPNKKITETEKFLAQLAHGDKINARSKRQKKSGDKIDVSIQGFPVSLNKRDMGYYVIYRNITELQESKNRYEEIKDRYKILFDNDDVAMLIIDPDNGEIIDANRASEKFYGWRKNQLIQMNIKEINTLSQKEIETEMIKAKSKNKKRFIFKHRLASNKIKEVEVYSQPIKYGNKEYLYSIIHDRN